MLTSAALLTDLDGQSPDSKTQNSFWIRTCRYLTWVLGFWIRELAPPHLGSEHCCNADCCPFESRCCPACQEDVAPSKQVASFCNCRVGGEGLAARLRLRSHLCQEPGRLQQTLRWVCNLQKSSIHVMQMHRQLFGGRKYQKMTWLSHVHTDYGQF